MKNKTKYLIAGLIFIIGLLALLTWGITPNPIYKSVRSYEQHHLIFSGRVPDKFEPVVSKESQKITSNNIANRDYSNHLKMEDRPVDWQPPFPDEEFSFNRFKNSTEFNEYLEYRFPVGTPRPEIERVLVRIGGADPRMYLTPEMMDNKQYGVTYSRWTWQRLLGRLLLSPDREAFVTVHYDRNSKLIKSFGDAP